MHGHLNVKYILGDMAGGFAVLKDVSKTLVEQLGYIPIATGDLLRNKYC